MNQELTGVDKLVSDLKLLIRESEYPKFTDEELAFYLGRNSNDLEKTAYDCLIMKSEDTSLVVSGLTMGDSSKYFLRLACRYQPNNSGILRGVF